MNTQTMKRGIRQSIIAARQKLTVAEHDEFSRVISGRITRLDDYSKAETVLAYMSFGAEFSTNALVQQVLKDGKALLLPKVNRSTKQLELYRVQDLQQDLELGGWDIPEPIPDRCIRLDALEQIDFILLPGVAFGRDGSRLGYGGGFYDKLLERIEQHNGHPVLVAAAFDMQLVNDIPQEATDRKIQWLLTENEVIDCSYEM